MVTSRSKNCDAGEGYVAGLPGQREKDSEGQEEMVRLLKSAS